MATRLERIDQQRMQKLDRIRKQDINPYPNRYQRTHTATQAVDLLTKQETAGKKNPMLINIGGRIMAIRKMGKGSFVDIRDGSGKIQLLFQNMDGYDEKIRELFENLDIGDIIGASGKIFRTRRGEPTVEVEDFTLLAKSLHPLPEKWHGLSDVDTRYRQRYLDLIANTEVKEAFKMRSQIITAIRQFLNERGFLEVETPILQSAAGGALAKPFITHHNTLDQDYYLRIALELYLKRLIVGGYDKVYEIGRTFRNEGISTRHNPEFTMLESYEAYADYKDVMNMVEEMVSKIIWQILGKYEVNFGDDVISFEPPWQRVDLRQTIEKYSGINIDKFPDVDTLRDEMLRLNMEADPKKDRGKLIDWLISTFVEPKLVQPTFLLDYPLDMSPLAKAKPGEDGVVERFEAFAGGIEIANAFSELNDPLEQRRRFTEQLQMRQGEDEEKWTIDEDYLHALEYGMPPTGGLGIGIDRLVMLLTGQESIREVILFPQLREKPQ
ncbi:MAG: lysine--tRNA ligase [Dehalococcoidales bacterium]|nr:lysine--tRNA ligase [Dehalococcoidales bacterium]